jgi:hypothetical protein
LLTLSHVYTVHMAIKIIMFVLCVNYIKERYITYKVQGTVGLLLQPLCVVYICTEPRHLAISPTGLD